MKRAMIGFLWNDTTRAFRRLPAGQQFVRFAIWLAFVTYAACLFWMGRA